MLSMIALYVCLGAFAGILAGLLGVGGGIVIVPMLVIAYTAQGFSPDLIMHLALGTSLASIMFTSISSAYSHHKRGGVDWHIIKCITFGIIIGTYGGSFVAAKIPRQYLQIFFSVFLFYVAFQMIFNKQPKLTRKMPGVVAVNGVGIIIGTISSLVGIGGGTLSVPFMVWHNVEMRKAIGTSSAIGIPIAFSGCLGYVINGLSVANLPEYCLGYVFLPALACIVLCSMFTAPYGAKLAHTLPVPRIKKIFAVLLLIVGTNMLFSAL